MTIIADLIKTPDREPAGHLDDKKAKAWAYVFAVGATIVFCAALLFAFSGQAHAATYTYFTHSGGSLTGLNDEIYWTDDYTPDEAGKYVFSANTTLKNGGSGNCQGAEIELGFSTDLGVMLYEYSEPWTITGSVPGGYNTQMHLYTWEDPEHQLVDLDEGHYADLKIHVVVDPHDFDPPQDCHLSFTMTDTYNSDMGGYGDGTGKDPNDLTLAVSDAPGEVDYCGDDLCTNDENPVNCPADCPGEPPPPPPSGSIVMSELVPNPQTNPLIEDLNDTGEDAYHFHAVSNIDRNSTLEDGTRAYFGIYDYSVGNVLQCVSQPVPLTQGDDFWEADWQPLEDYCPQFTAQHIYNWFIAVTADYEIPLTFQHISFIARPTGWTPPGTSPAPTCNVIGESWTNWNGTGFSCVGEWAWYFFIPPATLFDPLMYIWDGFKGNYPTKYLYDTVATLKPVVTAGAESCPTWLAIDGQSGHLFADFHFDLCTPLNRFATIISVAWFQIIEVVALGLITLFMMIRNAEKMTDPNS